MNKDAFSSYHPAVNFIYFALVLAFSMVFMHPVCLCVSLACGVSYAIMLGGRKTVSFQLTFLLPVLLVAIILNPVFNHEGVTIIRYLPNGNPLTKESIVYGFAAAAMLCAVVSWFSCLNGVVTSDKLVWLFGRLAPALSLLFSMTLRFVPRFRARLRTVANAQKMLGRGLKNGSLPQRLRNGAHILSCMITWALESSVETADSMRCRGYGLKGRTAFSVFRFDRRDAGFLVFTLVCAGYIVFGAASGAIEWQYYPSIRGALAQPFTISVYCAYLLLALAPPAINIREGVKWNALRSAV